MGRVIELPNSRSLEIQEFTNLDDDAGAVLWDAGLVLIHYLLRQHTEGHCLVNSKAVIELGCGTAAVGLVAGALGARKVALTDLPHIIPYVNNNIQANKLVLKSGQAQVQALPLAWGDERQFQAAVEWLAEPCLLEQSCQGQGQQQAQAAICDDSDDTDLTAVVTPTARTTQGPTVCPDVVLASDLVYQVEQLPKLCSVLKALLSLPRPGQSPPLVLLSYEDRGPIDQQFWQCMKQEGVQAREVPPDELHESWRCEDIHVFVLTAASSSSCNET